MNTTDDTCGQLSETSSHVHLFTVEWQGIVHSQPSKQHLLEGGLPAHTKLVIFNIRLVIPPVCKVWHVHTKDFSEVCPVHTKIHYCKHVLEGHT